MNNFALFIFLLLTSNFSFPRSYSLILLEKSEITFIDNLKKQKKWEKCNSNQLSSNARYICYNYLAYTLRKTEPCEKLDSQYYTYICYGYVAATTKNKKICQNIPHPIINKCYKPDLKFLLDSMNPDVKEKRSEANKTKTKSGKMEEIKYKNDH